jgi:hypothetical protein
VRLRPATNKCHNPSFLLKVSVSICSQIKAHWILSLTIIHVSLISILYQPIEGEDVGKDWKTITFRQDHAIHLKKNSYCVFMCLRANRGECQHAVCHECHEKRSKEQKRSRGSVLREDELIKSCHHELCNLQICADMWWCTKDHLGGPQWIDRPKGCAFCERMFNVGDKWMRMCFFKAISGLWSSVEYPKGCAFCARVFNVGDKWMRLFCVKNFMASYFRTAAWVSRKCARMSRFITWMEGVGWSVFMFWLCGSTFLCDSILQGEVLELGILTD